MPVWRTHSATWWAGRSTFTRALRERRRCRIGSKCAGPCLGDAQAAPAATKRGGGDVEGVAAVAPFRSVEQRTLGLIDVERKAISRMAEAKAYQLSMVSPFRRRKWSTPAMSCVSISPESRPYMRSKPSPDSDECSSGREMRHIREPSIFELLAFHKPLTEGYSACFS